MVKAKTVLILTAVVIGILSIVGVQRFSTLWSNHYKAAEALKIMPPVFVGIMNDLCSQSNNGVLRINPVGQILEICSNGIWKSVDSCVLSPRTPCADGTYFSGVAPDSALPMFTAPCDASGYWGGMACVPCEKNNAGLWTGSGKVCGTEYGSSTGAMWSDAKKYCENLSAYGHNDWQLPSREEINVVDAVRSFIRKKSTLERAEDPAYFWSSSEASNDGAWFHHVETRGGDTSGKDRKFGVICIRK